MGVDGLVMFPPTNRQDYYFPDVALLTSQNINLSYCYNTLSPMEYEKTDSNLKESEK